MSTFSAHSHIFLMRIYAHSLTECHCLNSTLTEKQAKSIALIFLLLPERYFKAPIDGLKCITVRLMKGTT